MVSDRKVADEEGVPSTSKHVELPVDSLNRISEKGEFERRAQDAVRGRLGICFHLGRLYLPLLWRL